MIITTKIISEKRTERVFICKLCKQPFYLSYLNEAKTIYKLQCSNCHNRLIAEETEDGFKRIDNYNNYQVKEVIL